MGSIIGGIGSAIIGSKSAKSASKRQARATERATQASLTGFRFLEDNPVVNEAQDQGQQAQGLISGLLGLDGDPAAANEAFQRFQDSTGFQFRTDRGIDAITGNRATRGLLNSGGTLKALNDFGQGIGSEEFSNFLAQLGALQGSGLNAAFNTASQGTSGGAGAASAGLRGVQNINAIRRQGTEDVVSGLGSAFGGLSSIFEGGGFGGFGGGSGGGSSAPSSSPRPRARPFG